ncbi:putative CCR4-associated factor 1 homolog 8 [Cornus florida]|uniref:putative CCR4-associated factor 1 homolog 8 n=1 Tax=Cornus florida TaxID=4283 RepID=UPI00289F9717|nr:putative CCR4-associated factor 1 homolog 8 [Cornus florida]
MGEGSVALELNRLLQNTVRATIVAQPQLVPQPTAQVEETPAQKQVVRDEANKTRKFVSGLNDRMRPLIAAQFIKVYSEAVERALMLEADNREKDARREQLKQKRAIDTEFIGFLHVPSRNASEDEHYHNLKYNTDRMRLTQIGFTLFDNDRNIGGTWQFNFRKSVGVNFKKNQHGGLNLKGVDMNLFAAIFRNLVQSHHSIQWITFHGLYDIAYIIKLVTGSSLSDSPMEFIESLGNILGRIYDVKYITKYCRELLCGEMDLERMANMLGVCRLGIAHQSCSDSLLTACVFLKMKEVYQLIEERFEGFLYGVSTKIEMNYELVTICCSPQYLQHLRRCSPFNSICGGVDQWSICNI